MSQHGRVGLDIRTELAGTDSIGHAVQELGRVLAAVCVDQGLERGSQYLQGLGAAAGGRP